MQFQSISLFDHRKSLICDLYCRRKKKYMSEPENVVFLTTTDSDRDSENFRREKKASSTSLRSC